MLGSANSNATVTVNLQRAIRQGSYFWDELSENNAGAALYVPLTNLAVLNNGANPDIVATNVGNVLIAPTPQTFTYDVDGNLTSDGLWTNVWNAENRLLSVESLPTVPASARVHEDWSYLPDGRWNQRIVSIWNTNTLSYQPSTTNRFVWDGQVLMAILDQTNGLVMSFMRGLDLSGTIQGAGGVGGLLAINFKTNGTHFVTYDGNGNVAGLVNAADGTASANYEYDPFGQTLRITGPVAKWNPIRFSTQFADDVVGDVKYLYRDYVPNTGRWPNRDPLAEKGATLLRNPSYYSTSGEDSILGIDLGVMTRNATEQASYQEETSLYLFNANDGMNKYDLLGTMTLSAVNGIYNTRAAQIDAANVMCRCDCGKKQAIHTYSISGGPFGGSMIYADSSWEDCEGSQCCGPFNSTYFWWDCYSSAEEHSGPAGDVNYGWSQGGVNYFKSATPSTWAPITQFWPTSDPYHLAVCSIVMYEQCVNGKLQTQMNWAVNVLYFTWNKSSQSWTGPTAPPRGPY